MEERELMNLWKSYDKKLEENLVLNRKNADDITRIKIRSLLGSMKPLKIFTLLAGLLWVGVGATIVVNLFLFAYDKVSTFFLISAAIQLGLTAAAIVIYIYQLILIENVDISDSVLRTQEKIASLKSSTIWSARLLLLQLPVWTTFYWSRGMWESGNISLYLINGIITLIFTAAAVWLFFNIRYKNSDKKWFNLIFSGKEWSPMIKSLDLLSQIKETRDGIV